MKHLKNLFCSIFLTTVALVAGSANALTFVTDDEAALQTRLTQAQIDNARAEGRTEADKAKIALWSRKSGPRFSVLSSQSVASRVSAKPNIRLSMLRSSSQMATRVAQGQAWQTRQSEKVAPLPNGRRRGDDGRASDHQKGSSRNLFLFIIIFIQLINYLCEFFCIG